MYCFSCYPFYMGRLSLYSTAKTGRLQPESHAAMPIHLLLSKVVFLCYSSRTEYTQHGLWGQQSLKYLLSGPLQKKVSDPL